MIKLPHVVSVLRKARDEHHRECERIDHALAALNLNHGQPGRVLSKAAREKIGKAQKERWAKFHAKNKKKTGSSATKVKRKGNPGANNFWSQFKTKEARRKEMERRGMIKKGKK